MRRDKKKVIIIASIIATIVIVLIVGLVLYFTTDFLKNDQTLFLKYLSKNVEVMEKYLEDPNQSAITTLKGQPYTIESDINFDLVSSDPEIANQTIPPRNFSIAYTKNVDPQNNRDKSEAKAKYLTKDLFNATYVHDGDKHVLNGVNLVTSSPIINMYLGIDNNNLKQLAEKLGVQDTSKIPNRIEKFTLADLTYLSKEEKGYIQNQLLKVLNTQISKDKFYHVKGQTIEIDTKQITANAYGVILTKEEYQNVIVSILEAISNDDTILNSLLQKIMLVDSQTDLSIDSLKTQIQNIISGINIPSGIKVKVYESDGELVRTQIETDMGDNYVIDYERDTNAIRTVISLDYIYNEETQIQQPNNDTNTINDEYPIIEGSQTPTPEVETKEPAKIKIRNIELAKQVIGSQNNVIAIITYEKNDKIMKVSIQNKTEQDSQTQTLVNNIIVNINNSDTTYFEIKANSNIAATTNVQVEELNDTNSAVLNNRTPENISQLLNAIKTKLQRTYEQLMQVSKEVQEQEDAQNGLNNVDTNVPESNTITNNENVIQ